MQSEFLYNPHGQGEHAHAASVASFEDGALIASWYAYDGHHDYQNARLVFTRQRFDGTWEKGSLVHDDIQSSVGNPTLYVCPETQKIYLFFVVLKGKYWNDAVLHLTFSNDGGHTWTAPSVIHPDRGMMARHRPVPLSSGQLLLPAYDEASDESVLLMGKDLQWEECYRFRNTPIIQPDLVKLGSNDFILLFRPSGDPRIIWRSRSTDGARSWSTPIKTTLPCPLSGVAAFAAVDRLWVVYNHTHETQRYPLSLSYSEDSGVTWSDPIHFDSVNYEISYPSFHTNIDGSVTGLYTYNRRFIKYVRFEAEDLLEYVRGH